MKKTLISLIFASTVATIANAQSFEQKYFEGQDPVLNAQEKKALEIYQKWSSDNQQSSKPFYGKNGAINYVFGASQPSIVCAVLQICDIALQPGEKVNNINIGDSARWVIEPSIVGAGDNATIHVIVKPLDVNLNTSMIISTNKRVYHMRLRSHSSQYMPYVYFTYPEDVAARWDKVLSMDQQKRESETFTNGVNINDLDFNFKISGSGSFKPERVYQNGHQTVIEFGKNVQTGEMPVLYVLRGNEQQMVNYRVADGYKFVVDSNFDKAIIVAGAGKSQQKITITKTSR